jgi:hypothetical protein
MSKMRQFPYFPLYGSLFNSTKERDELTKEEKDQLCERVKEMSDEQHATFYALIQAYHLDHNQHVDKLPYGGKTLKAGTRFDVDCFPSELQKILYHFSTIQ